MTDRSRTMTGLGACDFCCRPEGRVVENALGGKWRLRAEEGGDDKWRGSDGSAAESPDDLASASADEALSQPMQFFTWFERVTLKKVRVAPGRHRDLCAACQRDIGRIRER